MIFLFSISILMIPDPITTTIIMRIDSPDNWDFLELISKYFLAKISRDRRESY